MSKKVLEFDLTGIECKDYPTEVFYLPCRGDDIVAGMKFTRVFDYLTLPGDSLVIRLDTKVHSKVLVFVGEFPSDEISAILGRNRGEDK